MRCTNAKKLIPFLVNNELDESKRPKVEEHLHRCPACQAVAAEYANLSRLARTFPGLQEPPGFYDGFFREILNRVPENRRVDQRTDQARAVRHAFRPRYAMAGIGLVLAAILLVVLFNLREDTTRHVQRPTLEIYLKQSDFIGLARAMEDDQQRNKLMTDTVSVDLLIDTIARLQRFDMRYGHLSRYVTQWIATIQREQSGMPVTLGADIKRNITTAARRTITSTQEFDFKTILWALRNIYRPGARITLNDLANAWAFLYKSRMED